MALLLKSTAADLSERLERIEGYTANLLANLSADSQQDILSTLQKVNRALATRYKDIRVETNRGARQVAIDRIYIPSKLRAMKVPQVLGEILSLEAGRKRGKDLLTYDPSVEQLGKVTYGEFCAGFRRAIVLGDPGGGKSTLCQYLCYHLAKQFNLAQQYDVNEHGKKEDNKIDPQVMKIPLRIVLRSFEGARLSTPQLIIFDYIVNDLKSVITLPTNQLQNLLCYALTYGYGVLAFDGLDEILNTGIRREFVDLVTAFCNEFPLCPVFITSRVVGYDDAPLPDEFEQFTLEKFDEKEVTQYLTKFLKIFTNEKQDQAAVRADHFLKQTHGTASDLRQNPLMLGLMAFLFVTKGDVPTNRPEIYRAPLKICFSFGLEPDSLD